MMHMMNFGYGGWMMGGMWLLPILFLALIIAGVLLVVRWMGNGRDKTSSAESPLDILRTRYAKGEIDRETFDKIKQDIDANHSER